MSRRKIFVNEEWCLGCHLCEYYCAFANSHSHNMAKALKGIKINPRIQVEEGKNINFAVSCRHCPDPLCVKSCVSGALYKTDDVIKVNTDKCISCYTCVLVCPFGAIMPSDHGVMQKCELCTDNPGGEPACVKGCPNKAIECEVY